ncbi:MAG: PqqD family protein [Candidatus Schekmanbacteria bacterium]|nr:PqqD family protein [Candidatus Schekmanbacteria bacterium]
MNRNISIPETVLWRKDGNQVVLFDEERGEPYLLNETASRIWELCSNSMPVNEITAALMAEFEGDQQVIKTDTLTLLTLLEKKGLLRFSASVA